MCLSQLHTHTESHESYDLKHSWTNEMKMERNDIKSNQKRIFVLIDCGKCCFLHAERGVTSAHSLYIM